MAEQPQTPQVKLRLAPQVDGFVSGSRTWFMLQYRCPEKRKQALRGRNLPRDIRAEVRQGMGLGEITILRGQSFSYPWTPRHASQNPGVWGRAPVQPSAFVSSVLSSLA